MTTDLLLGIDIGTSSAKAILMRPDGRRVGLGTKTYAVDTPQPGWAEQRPETWIEAIAVATHAAMHEAESAPGDIRGIGLSGQMHGTVCMNTTGNPVRPAIIWADQRSGEEVTWVRETLGKTRLAKWTGNPLATGFMLASWLWLKRHEPDSMTETAALLLPKDYVRYRLTGLKGTEPSDASSTLLFNPRERTWSQPLADALDLNVAKLPPVSPSAAIAGGLTSTFAQRLGLVAGTPVIFGGSDQAMQALGNGLLDPGTLSATIGTGGQLFAPTAAPIVDPELRMHSFCHIVPDRWHVETAMLSAGLSLKWLKNQVLDGDDYGALADAAAEVPAGAEGLIFQPYLLGERTPHMDPEARGSFIGLTRRHGRAHMIRAVMEGVVFALRQGLDLMTELGVPCEQILASGGATHHPLWLQLQADIFNRPIHRTATQEAAAKGAAMLAGLGVGVYQDGRDAIDSAVERHPEVITPDPRRVARYAGRFPVYCNLYPALADITHRLTSRV
jgi:xylulokinase